MKIYSMYRRVAPLTSDHMAPTGIFRGSCRMARLRPFLVQEFAGRLRVCSPHGIGTQIEPYGRVPQAGGYM